MAARNPDLERRKQAFRNRFRRDRLGLSYARHPGGEGRLLSEREALAFIGRHDDALENRARWFGRAIWASVLLPILLGIASHRLDSIFLGLCSALSLFTWLFAALFLGYRQSRLEQDIWAQVERRPAVPALNHHERVKRGYRLSLRDWACLILILPLIFLVKLPSNALPPDWQGVHSVVKTAMVALVALCLVLLLLRRLLRKPRRPAP
ncbi:MULTISPECIES: hypothetical protein [Sphingobium]|uniref:Uncharacterized protein n=1 Tax=Sphingobium yanoikuyae ATCC 51230 TaxID=883163 RepID=K9D4Z9_SPHYA|nr:MULTISPECIES: hypothetical protein [Sphingobium]EKU74022.1 hypothetical protein HMPREF9718_03351 [Sphingobium yanoikuyae ATCC 51230]WQE07681.1 hypothetical protein U0025_02040 [Sphingobium yanoikuyae]SHM36664.1 hypothetical protein SAMN05518668_108161 [Sphingobium sp. YR657]